MTVKAIEKQKIAELSLDLNLTVDWKRNSEKITDLIEKHFPFVDLAACWSHPGDYNFFTPDSEEIFKNYFKDIKRADMVQSRELIPLNNPIFQNTFVVSINLDGMYLGMLLIKAKNNVSVDLLKDLVKAISPQISLAKYATTMASEVEKRTSTDKLTGLWNRNYFNERFRDEVSRIHKGKEIGAVVVISFDELAGMEKVLSKEEHESLILKASNLTRKIVRKTDWVVYWDKHEILIYLDNTQPDSTIDVMTRCVNQFVSTHPLLTPVIGLCNTNEGDSARALIQLSARRLELARKDGRKSLVCFATKEGMKFLQISSKTP